MVKQWSNERRGDGGKREENGREKVEKKWMWFFRRATYYNGAGGVKEEKT